MIINEKLIQLDLKAEKKEEVIYQMGKIAKEAGRISDLELFCSKVKEREETVSTDMGFGIAIPHGKTDSVENAFIVFAKMKKPIIWNVEEQSMVDLVFMLGSPEHSESNIHLVVLSALARRLVDSEFVGSLRAVNDIGKIMKVFESLTNEEREEEL